MNVPAGRRNRVGRRAERSAPAREGLVGAHGEHDWAPAVLTAVNMTAGGVGETVKTTPKHTRVWSVRIAQADPSPALTAVNVPAGGATIAKAGAAGHNASAPAMAPSGRLVSCA